VPSGDQAGGLGIAMAFVCTSFVATMASGPWAGWSSNGSSMWRPSSLSTYATLPVEPS
jgi:hypothetical protein